MGLQIQPPILLNLNFRIMHVLWNIISGDFLIIYNATAAVLLCLFFFSMVWLVVYTGPFVQ